MSLLDKLQHLAFDDLARTEAGSAILLVSESEYAELREFAAHTCTVTLAGPQILDLYEACGGEFTELTSWTVGAREAFVTDDGEQMPAGMYATCTEYPEEGFIGPLGVGSEADSATAGRCPSPFLGQYQCELPAGHEGPHVCNALTVTEVPHE